MATQASSIAPDMVVETSKGTLYQPVIDDVSNAKADRASTESHLETIQAKYVSERERRLRREGNAQYVQLSQSEKFKHLARDCWIEGDQTPRLILQNGMHTKVFIVGGGFAGILHAVRLIQAGIKPDDIIIAEVAGGYGGTWYWNRYPGLMCDVESYIYLPLLEETGYMPKHKYSYGSEIRGYVNQIAAHWSLENRGAFQQSVQQLTWNDSNHHWQLKTQDMSTNETVELTADFVVVASGLLSKPKLTEFTGMDKYKGHFFHTARWDYDYTGGSPDDPSLTKLKGKRVGIIGTGATAIQSIPHLANWADELYVFQRTPSAVDQRDQRATDPKHFAEVISKQKHWQQERNKNFNSFVTNAHPLPNTDMVNDGWSHMPSMSAIVAGPKPVTMDKLSDHIESLHSLDLPRQERIRDRVSQIVQDPATASKLKPWYPGWCKRPCFHDDYLQVFNQPHVHLIDTAGKGIDQLTSDGIIANGHETPLDCIVFGTGYDLEGSISPAKRASLIALGRGGISLDDKWQTDIATLHGVFTRDFPNLFFTGPTQAAASPNYSGLLDQLATHSAYIISQAHTHTSNPSPSNSNSPIIEPTREAEEQWTAQIMSMAMTFSAVSGCTPGYLNGEGAVDRMTTDEQIMSSRGSLWGKGINDFVEVLEDWRREGSMKGVDVTVV